MIPPPVLITLLLIIAIPNEQNIAINAKTDTGSPDDDNPVNASGIAEDVFQMM